jgi:3-oxoadipate enol-lactonase
MFCKTRDGLNVYYELKGNPSSHETIVFLNGLTQSTQSWGLLIPYFKDKYRIVLLDLIFQGQSDKVGEWRDFDQHAEDVKAVIDNEKLCPVYVVGISYGSLVAQHFALQFPDCVKKLTLVSTFASKTPYYEAIELAWWRALEKGGYNLMLDVMLPSVLSEDYFSNPLIPIQAMKDLRKEANQNKEALFKLMKATKERTDYRQHLKGIRAPTLIIQGEKDLLLPVHMAEDVKVHIQGARLIVIRNAGHTLNLEHISEVSGEIRKFIG